MSKDLLLQNILNDFGGDEKVPAVELFNPNAKRHLEIIEGLTDGFFLLDENGRFIYVNNGAIKFLRDFPRSLLGQCIWELFPHLIGTPLFEGFQRSKREVVSIRFEFNHTYSELCSEVYAYSFETGLIVFLRDITEQKMTEKTLIHSYERALKIFDASPAMMAIHQLSDWRLVDANTEWLKILGYEYEDVICRTPDELNLFVNLEAAKKIIDYTGQKSGATCRVRSKTGEFKDVFVRAEKIDFEGDECILFAAVDVTEAIKIRNELQHFDKLNLIGEMAAGLAHEVRNPLTTIKGFLQLFQSKENLSEFKPYFEVMLSELDRTNNIISEFLSLAKNSVMDLELGNLNDIVNTLFPLLQADAIRTCKYLEVESGNIPEIMLVENEIRQCILNLIRNGLEASAGGGKVMVKTYEQGDKIVLAVQDNGSGIPPEILARLGTSFLTTKEKGTGLGLPICYRIAERHNAKIEVETSSSGTTFRVEFPKVQ